MLLFLTERFFKKNFLKRIWIDLKRGSFKIGKYAMLITRISGVWTDCVLPYIVFMCTVQLVLSD